jgi:hypothetical protein
MEVFTVELEVEGNPGFYLEWRGKTMVELIMTERVTADLWTGGIPPPK